MKRLPLLIALLCIPIPAVAQVTVSLAPVPRVQFLSASGAPLAGGFVYTYAAGTTTPQATYTDASGIIQNTNPIVLDSGGRTTIWIAALAYKFCVADSNNVQQWCVDNISDLALIDFQQAVLLTGNQTINGTKTFSLPIAGSINGNAGTATSLVGPGTVTGTYTHNGVENFLAAITSPGLNNTTLVDGTTFACSATGINSAIANQIAKGGGTVDARGCTSLTSYTAEIDVGNGAGVAIDLLVPHTGSWACNLTGGTSYCLKLFNNSSAIGSSASFSTFQIQPASSSVNVVALCGNDTSVANAHIRMEGFECNIFSTTATMGKAVGYFSGLGDGSLVGHMTFGNLSSTNATKVLWVNNSCCATTFEDVVADAFAIAGVTPCWFGNGTSGPNLNIKVDGISCAHAGSGASNLVDQEWNQLTGNVFKNVYMEYLSGADTTTAWISVQAFGVPTGADTFIGVLGGGDVVSSTRYLFDIASGAHAVIMSAQEGNVSTNAINDHNGGGILVTAPVNTTIGSYSTEKQLINYPVASGPQSVTGCTLTTPLGGAMAGVFFSGTSGTCTVTITPGITAPNGYVCDAHDETTVTDVINQISYTQTQAVISGTTASSDRIVWKCVAF